MPIGNVMRTGPSSGAQAVSMPRSPRTSDVSAQSPQTHSRMIIVGKKKTT